MKTYIALLRGINVSGQKKVPMAELRQLLSDSGLFNVSTYIQSGNVVFQSVETNIKQLEAQIHDTIQSHFGFDVPILIQQLEALQYIFDACPFSPNKKQNSYFMLLYDAPKEELVADLYKVSYPNEEFVVTEHCVYFYSALGYGRAKCSNNFFEKKLKVTATARNYKTMVKLLSLSAEN
ncbi:DUF1697 domain-containing protein [Tamlana fucoidanivorans]|uniref:DUF1697 domain-containing protein n=1 Tax=Allotamlana fucoidanivorans TaxID=2583814 RepID=A0A5C4SK31_9FLAO|nr:DUF1697 domain-containing protein [Tamlana fucoidanivorans]TNJ43861.1 DUF1697 domain-containing protein [Tamlana fucoidanivorans]